MEIAGGVSRFVEKNGEIRLGHTATLDFLVLIRTNLGRNRVFKFLNKNRKAAAEIECLARWRFFFTTFLLFFCRGAYQGSTGNKHAHANIYCRTLLCLLSLIFSTS